MPLTPKYDGPRIIVAYEKHGERFLDATTDEAFALSALGLLTSRFNEGYWYYDPRQEKHPFSLKLRKEEEEAAALNLSDEDLAKLPCKAQEPIKTARARLRKRQQQDAEQAAEYDEIKEVVETQDTSFITLGRRRPRSIPRAWELLERRSDYEYERVELENLHTYVIEEEDSAAA